MFQQVKVPSVEALSCHRSYTRRREGRPTRRKLGSKRPRWLGEMPGQIRQCGRRRL